MSNRKQRRHIGTKPRISPSIIVIVHLAPSSSHLYSNSSRRLSTLRHPISLKKMINSTTRSVPSPRGNDIASFIHSRRPPSSTFVDLLHTAPRYLLLDTKTSVSTPILARKPPRFLSFSHCNLGFSPPLLGPCPGLGRYPNFDSIPDIIVTTR